MAVFYPQCTATVHVIFDGFGGQEPDTATTFEVRPRRAIAHLNSYREADTFEVEFDAAAFPFSPELIRSMAIELHMFQTDGLGGERPPEEETLVVAGLVDEARYHAGAEGRTFNVSGRDYTALMLDRQWDPAKSGAAGRFPSGVPLRDAVQQLVDEAALPGVSPADRERRRVLTVKVVGTDETPTLGRQNAKQNALVVAGKYRVSTKGKLKVPSTGNGNVHTNKRGVPVKGGANYWDVIYRQCVRLGFICYVRGTDVVISTPQTLTEATAGRLRSVAYGRDLADLTIDRKLGKETVPQIQVVSYDPVTMQSVAAAWPQDRTTRTTAIGTKKDEIRVVTVHGVNDVGRLLELAKTFFHSLARSEGTVRFRTRDLRDLDGNDLLFLRPGDPVQIGFDGLNAEDLRERSEAQRYEYLTGLGYDEQVAALIAREYDRINQFRAPFYTRDVELAWDVRDGLTVDVTALNYVAVGRDDQR